ncbi:MAG: N-methyl-L-tryptophan oxidase [Planctomycetaceae bacterium]
MNSYDAIVLGVGGFGSGALYHLARRGARVLGIERFGVAHDRGSSHGQTRIIRKAYFEHPDYVPLLHRAYALWHELERETGRALLHAIGLFLAGPPECESVAGTLQAAALHSLPVERLAAREARQRFGMYRFPEGFITLVERQAGYLAVEECVTAHVAAARRRGAELRTDETVIAWSSDGSIVRVQTDRGEYAAAKLVVTAGPWAAELLGKCSAPDTSGTFGDGAAADTRWSQWLHVVRKPMFWFPADGRFDVVAGNTAFFFETPEGQFYGFPRLDGQSIKVAEHTQGDAVSDPLGVDRTQHAADLERVARFLKEFLPDVARVPVRHSVCLYTKSPDGHFLIDKHPEFANVVVAAGFSGHGFKFTSVLGEALADLALEGTTKLPVGFLSLGRLGAAAAGVPAACYGSRPSQ